MVHEAIKTINQKQLAAMLGVTSRTIYNRLKAKSIPPPSQRYGNCKYWLVSEIETWSGKKRKEAEREFES